MLSKLAQRLMKPDPRRCEETRALMSSYVEADLEDSERRRVDRHVRFCPRCRTVLANLRHTIDRLGQLGGAPADAGVDSAAERVRSGWRERT